MSVSLKKITGVLGACLLMAHGVVQAGAFVPSPRPIKNQYIVILDGSRDVYDDLTGQRIFDPAPMQSLISTAYRGKIEAIWTHAVHGFAVNMTEADARALATDPNVSLVEEDGVVSPHLTQPSAPWHLDRIDQRDLPLNQLFSYAATGKGVNAYVLDSGIRRTHNEFRLAAPPYTRVNPGLDLVRDGRGTEDCMGHGTHVAGIIGGATYGVAKEVALYPVRIFGCSGGASDSRIISAIDWIAANHKKPAVVNMSLGATGSSLNTAVNNAIQKYKITFVVSAGNSSRDACGVTPASAPAAITVAASGSTDTRASFSNYGACVDIFAPGVGVTSSYYSSDSATMVMSGTSMAAPVVTGAVSQILTSGDKSPDQVWEVLRAAASTGKIGSANGPTNLLVYTEGDGAPPPPVDTVPPTVSLLAPLDGATVGKTISLVANAIDNVGVAKVEFIASKGKKGENNTVLATTSTPVDANGKFSATWNSASLANGAYVFWAKAYDAKGNTAETAGANVTVYNEEIAQTCTSTNQALKNPGFESGKVEWLTTSTAGMDVIIRSPEARSGAWLASLGGSGQVRTDTLSQTVFVPSDACSAKLSFWLKKQKISAGGIVLSFADQLKLEVTGTGIAPTLLATYTENAVSTQYQQKVLDLTAWKGKTIQIRFTGIEDARGATAFIVDDTKLDIVQ
ncbi:MAG: hypothetical protein RLZZ09_3207 [Pseudomonadota bacterium]|jgi:subtilisin family serine protease